MLSVQPQKVNLTMSQSFAAKEKSSARPWVAPCLSGLVGGGQCVPFRRGFCPAQLKPRGLHSLSWPLQIQKMGLATKDIKSFPALAELVAAARDPATAEQP